MDENMTNSNQLKNYELSINFHDYDKLKYLKVQEIESKQKKLTESVAIALTPNSENKKFDSMLEQLHLEYGPTKQGCCAIA
jgi:hypothetical protein